MRNKVFVLVMACSLIICSGNLMAKERRGADRVITKIDGQQITGELIAVKPSSLLLLDSQSGVDLSVAIEDIGTITIVKKSKALLGAEIGLALGAAVGALIGYLVVARVEPDMDEVTGYGGLIGGGAGLILGAGIGGYIGKDSTAAIAGKSPEQIKVVLEKLRSQARVTSFQEYSIEDETGGAEEAGSEPFI